jgi:hypothetical protein
MTWCCFLCWRTAMLLAVAENVFEFLNTTYHMQRHIHIYPKRSKIIGFAPFSVVAFSLSRHTLLTVLGSTFAQRKREERERESTVDPARLPC